MALSGGIVIVVSGVVIIVVSDLEISSIIKFSFAESSVSG